jgi:hypothetical protein
VPALDNTDPEQPAEGQFLVSVTAAGTGDGSNTYFIPTEGLEDAGTSITPVGSGLEVDATYSHYVQNGQDGFVALKYGQGGAHIGLRVTIAANGKATKVGQDFELQDGFVTTGKVGENVYTAMSGNRAQDKTKATFNVIPMSSATPKFAYMQVDNFTGYEGKNAAMIGIADAGDGSFYTGLDYSAEDIDELVVAKIKASSLTPEAVYSDTRLSKSGGQMKSARYSQIAETKSGDVYVFSGNYAGTKTAGAVVIKNGATGIDSEYFWDIEEASGGYRFRKVWYVQDNIFLVEFYNEKAAANESASGSATQYALLDMVTRKLDWISGLPSKADIADNGVKWPYVFGGKIYMGVTTVNEDPRIYVVDPIKKEATKGLLAKNAETIESVTFVAKK